MSTHPCLCIQQIKDSRSCLVRLRLRCKIRDVKRGDPCQASATNILKVALRLCHTFQLLYYQSPYSIQHYKLFLSHIQPLNIFLDLVRTPTVEFVTIDSTYKIPILKLYLQQHG